MNRRILGFSMIAAATLAGCGPLGSPGSLSTGAFGYVCSQTGPTTDLACGSTFFNVGDVPAAIAVGAHFDIQYQLATHLFSDDPSPVVSGLVPAAPSMLGKQAGAEAGATGFGFSAPGTVAILAETAGSSVVDFLHVTGVAFDHVALQDNLGQKLPATLAVPVNGASLQAVPQGLANQPLAGSMSYTWTSSDETVVKIDASSPPVFGTTPAANAVHLSAVGPGKATVTVQVGAQQAVVDVTVAMGGTP